MVENTTLPGKTISAPETIVEEAPIVEAPTGEAPIGEAPIVEAPTEEPPTEEPPALTSEQRFEKLKKIRDESPDVTLYIPPGSEPTEKEKLYERLKKAREEAQLYYLNDLSRGISSTMLKAFDLGPHAMVEALDLLTGKSIEFDKEKYKHLATEFGYMTDMIDRPEERPPVFGTPEGKFAPPSEEFLYGEFMGENLIFSLVAPLMAKIPYRQLIGPTGPGRKYSLADAPGLTKADKIKRFFSGIGKEAVENPKRVLAMETLAGAGGALGQLYANRFYPDSPAMEFTMSLGGGSAATAFPARMMFRGFMNFKDSQVLKYGGAAAVEKAKKRLQDASSDPVKALENLQKAGENFPPEIAALLTSGEMGLDEGLSRIQRSFIDEASDSVKLQLDERHQQIHDLIVKISATPSVGSSNAGDYKATKQALAESIESINKLIEIRLNIAKTKIANNIEEKQLLGKVSEKEANVIARDIIDREYEIARETDKELWDQVDKTMEVSTATIRETLEKILTDTRIEAGDVLKLEEKGAALGDADAIARFIGKMSIVKIDDVLLGSRTIKKFKPGLWGDTVELGAIQALRHRLLLEARGIRADVAPNQYKLSLLAQLDEAIISAVEFVPLKTRPTSEANAEAYLRALAFTREFKTQYNNPAVKKLMQVDKNGNLKVIEELTLDKIFTGKGAKGGVEGEKMIDDFLQAVRKIEVEGRNGDETAGAAVKEMRGALEHAIKARFSYECVTAGVIDTKKAGKFIEAYRHLWSKENFYQIKLDIEKATEFNDLKLLQISKYNEAKINLIDSRSSLATLYMKDSPDRVFNELTSDTYDIKKIQIELKRFSRAFDKAKTAQAKEGFESAFMQWMVRKAIKGNPENEGQIMSGLVLKNLWKSEKVQSIAKTMLTKERYKTLEQLVNSAQVLELAKKSHGAKGGVFNMMPNSTVERMMRWAVLKYSPMPDTGRGSIAAQQLVSTGVKETIRKHFRDPAISVLHKAFMEGDIELMKLLFTDIIKLDAKSAPKLAKHINAWILVSLHNLGERTTNEDNE